MNGELSGREGEPLDLSVRLEVDRWNGAVQPRVVAARALSARRGGGRARRPGCGAAAVPAPSRGVVGAARGRARRAPTAAGRRRSRAPTAAERARARGRGPPRRRRGRRARRAGLQRRVGARPLRRRLPAPRAGRRRPPIPRRFGAGEPRIACCALRRGGARRARSGAGADASRRARPRARRLGRARAPARGAAAASATSSWSTRRPFERLEELARLGAAPAARASCTWPGARAELELAERCLALRVAACAARSSRSGACLGKSGGEADGRGAARAARGPGPPSRARPRSPRAACAVLDELRPVRVDARCAPPRRCGSYPRRGPSWSDRGRSRACVATAPGGDAIPAKQSTEQRTGPAAPTATAAATCGRRARQRPQAPRARRDHRGADRRAARAARRPLRGDRGAQVRARRADRPRGDRARLRLRLREPRRPGAQVRRGLHHPPARRRADLRRPAPRHRDALRGAAPRHRRGHQRQPRRGRASASATRSPSSSTASPS